MLKVLKESSIKEYVTWLEFLVMHPACVEQWDHCDGCLCEDCGACFRNLFDLGEEAGKFLERVKFYVEGVVEELYVHPDWTPDERAEYGVDTEYLVNLYCEYYEV